jgi:hypothetical protein
VGFVSVLNPKAIQSPKTPLNPAAPEFKPCGELRDSLDSPAAMDLGPLVEVKAQEMDVVGLADSGAAVSLIISDLCEKLNLTPVESEVTLQWFEGSRFKTSGCVMVDIECIGQTFCVECMVVNQLATPLVLGRDFCLHSVLTIDFGTRSYWLSKMKPLVKWPLLGIPPEDKSLDELNCVEGQTKPKHESVDEGKHEQMVDLLKREFPDILKDVPGFTNVLEHEIKLVEGAKPVKQRPYHLSPAKEKAALEQIPKMLETGIIEESQSPWLSPVVMVPKANSQQYRMCIDFRELNKQTLADAYPLNRIEKIMSKLHGAVIFSVLDL